MAIDKSNINFTEKVSSKSLSTEDLNSLIDQISRIRLSLDQVEATLRSAQNVSTPDDLLPSLERSQPRFEQNSSRRGPSPPNTASSSSPNLFTDSKVSLKTQWGFTQQDKVRIKNTVEIGGFKLPYCYKHGYIVDFTPRFVKIKVSYKQGNKDRQKVVNREPHNVEHIK